MAESNDIKIAVKTDYDGSGWAKAGHALSSGWANIKAGFDLFVSGVKLAWTGVKKIFNQPISYEKQQTQFATLIGDIDKAADHMRDLKELGDTPPFSLNQFADASRTLLALTDGALGYKESLELIGDAAAATGQSMDSIASQVGYLYATIRDGEPLDRAAKALSRVGIISPETAAQLSEMQKAGATSTEIWQAFTESVSRFSGAMQATEATGSGLIGAIESRWDNVVREFGQSSLALLKDDFAALLEWLKRLEENGSVQTWAELAAAALEQVSKGIMFVARAIGKMSDFSERVGSAVGTFVAYKFSGDSDSSAGAWDAAKRDWAESGESAKRAAAEARAAARQAAADAAAAAQEASAQISTSAAQSAEAVRINAQLAAADEARAQAQRAAAAKQAAEAAAKARADADKKEAATLEAIERDKAAMQQRLGEEQRAAEEAAELASAKRIRDETIKILDEQINEAKKKLAEWEAEAKLARGVGADDWRHAEQVRLSDKAKSDARQAREMRRIQDETDRLLAKPEALRTEADRRRIAENQKWLAAQNPQNNPQIKALQDLQQKRDALRDKAFKDVGEIKSLLQQLGLK